MVYSSCSSDSWLPTQSWMGARRISGAMWWNMPFQVSRGLVMYWMSPPWSSTSKSHSAMRAVTRGLPGHMVSESQTAVKPSPGAGGARKLPLTLAGPMSTVQV